MPNLCKWTLPESKKSGIYLIINIKNNKKYVGSAVIIKRRTLGHYKELKRNGHRNKHLQAAWNIYGENCFKFSIIEEFPNPMTKEQLLEREQYWIDTLKTANNEIGYNLSPTAGSNQGYKHDDESRRKNSECRKGRSTKHATDASVLVTKGRPRPEEVKKKISDAQKGREFTEEHKENIKNTHWSKREDAKEIAEKTASKNRGKKQSTELVQKRVEGRRRSIIEKTEKEAELQKIYDEVAKYNPPKPKRMDL